MKSFLLLLLLLPIMVFSQPKQDSILLKKITVLQSNLDTTENKLKNFETLKEQFQFLKDINTQTLNSISTQLTTVSVVLAFFGVLFTIVAIGLGVYINNSEKKIVKIGEENRELLSKNQKIKDDVQELNRLIQSDIYGLYTKIKREETVHILDRLVLIPKDIANVSDTLLTRELQSEDYIKLKTAYQKLPDDLFSTYQNPYRILFFQHFFVQSLKDLELRETMVKFISNGVRLSFENDILKTTSDFATLLVDTGIDEYKKEANEYFKCLSTSTYHNYDELYSLLYSKLKTRENRFKIISVLEAKHELKNFIFTYGKLLNEYRSDATASELLVFHDIDQLSEAEAN